MARQLKPTETARTVRDRVQARMTELGLTPHTLSGLSGVSNQAIHRYLADGRVMGVSRFLAIIDALGLSVSLDPVPGFERPKVLPRGRPPVRKPDPDPLRVFS